MTLAQFISLLNIATLVAIMLSMGMQVKLSDVFAAARSPLLVGLGFLANYLAVPLITVGLLYAFGAQTYPAVGFLILAVCPGAPAGPPLTAMAKGNLPTAIGLMVILAGASSILSPLLLGWLLAWLAPESDLNVDFLAIARTLLLAQMLPLACGLGAGHFRPHFAARLAKPLSQIGNVLLLVLVGLILAVQFPTLLAIRAAAWGGMLLLLALSFLVGWYCGGADVANRKAMMLTTGVRNAAVGLVIAGGSFAGTAAVTAVVAYGLGSLLGGIALALALGAKGTRSV